MRHVIDLSRELVRRGHHVEIIYSPVRLEEGFKGRFFELENIGVKFHPLPMKRAPGPSDLSAIRLTKKILKNGQFDIVHAHSTKSGLVGRLAGKGLAKVFYTPHCLYTLAPEMPKWQRKPFAMMESWLQKYTEKVVIISKIELDEALRIGIRREKIHLGFNGIEDLRWKNRSEARTAYGIDDEDVVVGWISRFVDQKYPQLAIQTFAELASHSPNVRFVMAGEGPLWEECKQMSTDLGLSKRLTFVGMVKPPDFFPALDVYFLSSLHEGLPYVLIEALFAGLPIVTTPVGGAIETVGNSENGFVTDGLSPEELAEKLHTLVENQELRKKMSSTSLIKSKSFTVTAMVDDLEKMYLHSSY